MRQRAADGGRGCAAALRAAGRDHAPHQRDRRAGRGQPGRARGATHERSERKGYLDCAGERPRRRRSTTLEDAIRRIDRETRELLQETFDSVNRHFGSLFPALFGGGEAKLIMTGEEILDAGVQVMAQPPGKKNAAIHLLSGGEKALTAISLVFSLFQLNPAPFCLLDEVDAPLDDSNTERFCELVRADVGADAVPVHQPQQDHHGDGRAADRRHHAGAGVSRVVAVDIDEALRMREELAAYEPEEPMTDLQLGLLAIGALAVVAVVVYNCWQERSARREAERAFARRPCRRACSRTSDASRCCQPRRDPAPELRRPAATLARRARRLRHRAHAAQSRFRRPVVHEAWATGGTPLRAPARSSRAIRRS